MSAAKSIVSPDLSATLLFWGIWSGDLGLRKASIPSNELNFVGLA